MSRLRKWGTYLGWQNIVIALTIYVVTVFFGYFLLIKPLFREYDRILTEQEAVGNTYVKLALVNVETSIDSVNVQLGNLHRIRLDHESRIANETDLKALIPFIDNLGREDNLELGRVFIMDQTEMVDQNTDRHFVSLALTSRYFYPLLEFMKKLDTYPKWVLVESFTMKPVPDGNEMHLVVSMLVRRS